MKLLKYTLISSFLFTAFIFQETYTQESLNEASSSEQNQQLLEQPPVEQYFVETVKRYSDLDKNEYSFMVTLNNGHSFAVPATLEEVLSGKFYNKQPYELVSEEFVPIKPGFSNFNYRSLDGTSELKGEFKSLNSHWKPSGSEKIVTITRMQNYRVMGRGYYLVYFSDESTIDSSTVYRNSKVGDEFFQVQPPIALKGYAGVTHEPKGLVGVKDGRLIESFYAKDQLIQKTW